MRRFFTAAALLGLFAVPAVSFVGCAEESKVVEEKKVETPGGAVKEKTETTVEKTGDQKTP